MEHAAKTVRPQSSWHLPSGHVCCTWSLKFCTSLNRSIVSDRGICQVWVTSQLPARESESWPKLHGQGRQQKLQLLGEPRRQGTHHGRPDLFCVADLQRDAIPGWNEGIWQTRKSYVSVLAAGILLFKHWNFQNTGWRRAPCPDHPCGNINK